ncbi:MAG TPA: tripartite tricarboxylate transporter substrate binding protein [Burkholderiales bacterium]|jgi:tripartite-type tricarboxylate transporter receptor subunit TctC|nr:tripartite tricarboxylate transporter substrate binding protein [Burkholderiales bacterium]
MKRLAAFLLLSSFTAFGLAQGYPAKPVRVIVGFAPGGGTDIIARVIAQKLTERWGQSVFVENKLGASGNIGADLVAKSPPDGQTLLMAFSSHSSNAALSKLPFDINRDFSSITLVCSAPAVIIGSLQAPRTLREVIAYGKANPGALKFGSSGVGGTVHLAGELMQQMAGIEMVHVPYKGIALVMTSMLSGDIQLTYATPLSGAAHFKSGRLVPIAVAGRTRYPSLPDVPTAAEAGLPGYEVEFWYGLLGPAGMPAPIVDRIQRDVAALVNAPEMKQSLSDQGCISSGSRPEELTALIRNEYAQWSKLVKERGVKAE